MCCTFTDHPRPTANGWIQLKRIWTVVVSQDVPDYIFLFVQFGSEALRTRVQMFAMFLFIVPQILSQWCCVSLYTHWTLNQCFSYYYIAPQKVSTLQCCSSFCAQQSFAPMCTQTGEHTPASRLRTDYRVLYSLLNLMGLRV